MRKSQEEFDAHGYLLFESAIDPGLLKILRDHALKYALSGTARADNQVPGTAAAYADPLMEDLLAKLLPTVEGLCGRELYPTYSYYRVYKRHDALPKHTDRPACEISLSLCLGYEMPEPWPLYVEGYKSVFAASLRPGDGLLYKGGECSHWREPLNGLFAAQAFLHYVDKNGRFADWRFDKRPALRCSPGPSDSLPPDADR